MGRQVHQCAQPGCHAVCPLSQRYCDRHTRDKPRDTQADRQYDFKRKHDEERGERNAWYRNNKDWQRVRLVVLKRDHHVCQYCELLMTTSPATLVDHIVPREVAPALSLDQTNLVAACASCHRIKTSWEQRYYGTGQGRELRSDVVWVRDICFLAGEFKRAYASRE